MAKSTMGDAKMFFSFFFFFFFSPLNLVNFEVVIANLIRELCDESLTAKCVSVLVQRSSLIRTENMSYAVLTQLWASSQL